MPITYQTGKLTSVDYQDLKDSAGWGRPLIDQVNIALSNSRLVVSAMDGKRVVGMGRLIGDGAIIWYLQDVIVLPDYQGRGIGKAIVQRLVACAKENSVPDSVVQTGLMAAKGKEEFYEKLGFRARPNEEQGAGMLMLTKIDEA